MQDLEPSGELSPTKQALVALKELQNKLKVFELRQHEAIAVIGMNCRFPGGADNLEAFWELLRDKKDGITKVPKEHWDNEKYYDSSSNLGKIITPDGGFVPHLKTFDAQFFRISPREAMSLDPQQRLVLEVAWEALENAAIAPDKLNGSKGGVFMGICGNDYLHQLLKRNLTDIDAYLSTGNTHSLASGRLSYILGLRGPSLSVNTACSSSLVALHLGVTSLRHQECDLALVGGVNRLISPEISINFSQAKMLSPQGRCKTFDAGANGFVRAEGCGILVLKRLSDAITAKDNIKALIHGSATNQDGRTSGLTVPNGLAQQAVIRQALKNSQIQPHEVSYIETHGTATLLGDPIEVEALAEVFASHRPKNQPLVLGAVKSNIGHSEAAAGIAGLIKVILCLQHKTIPPQLHFHTPNPHIRWEELPLTVPTGSLPWLEGEKPRIAGVSSFGFSGTNAHVIVGEAPAKVASQEKKLKPKYYLLTLSAKNEPALNALVDKYCTFLAKHPDLCLTDLCYTAHVGRAHFNIRLGIITSSLSQLQQQLRDWLNKKPTTGIFSGNVVPNRVLEIASVLSEDREKLSLLANLYIQGGSLDWSSFESNYQAQKINLPTYAFQRTVHWSDFSS